ncbi:MAG: Macrolide export protein MacA [Pelotomaculum sp. PtaB.Bin104]|nr:MAG: Macrolide export protein MacA [Pelotomaculum sp. PtaB.Bin104]
MGKWLRIAMAALLVASIFGLAGCASNGEQGAVTVSKAAARNGKLTCGVVVSGKLEALKSANVVPNMSGRVDKIPVDVGSEVAEGDLLVSLDALNLAALVDVYAAQLDKARNSDLPAQKNQMELALTNAESSYKTAEAEYQRSKQLLDAALLSQQQFEQSEKQYIQAKAAYQAAQNNLNILVNATIPETIRQNEAQLKKAQADLDNSVIKAPISGIVTARNINPGEMASPAQPVVTLVDLDTVVVQANVDENQVNDLQAGQEIKVKVAAVQEELFTGTVTNIAMAANSSTKAYPVKVQIKNPGHTLKPGMFAEVYLNSQEEEGVIIPGEALMKSENKSYVWLINSGQALKREVAAGQSDGNNVVINLGLNEGEEVAVTNLDLLSEGKPVIIQ